MNYTNDGLYNIANSTTEQPRDNTVQTLQVIAVTLLILITFLGTIGNILVFKAIFSLKKRKINDYLILNLAATDAGTCLVSIPLDAGEKMMIFAYRITQNHLSKQYYITCTCKEH